MESAQLSSSVVHRVVLEAHPSWSRTGGVSSCYVLGKVWDPSSAFGMCWYHQATNQFSRQRRQIQPTLQPCHFSALDSLRVSASDQERDKTKRRQKKKFELLLNKRNAKHNPSTAQNMERWVVNLSTTLT